MEGVSAGGGIEVWMVGALRSGRVSGTAMLVECPPSRRRVEVVWFNGTKSQFFTHTYPGMLSYQSEPLDLGCKLRLKLLIGVETLGP